MQDHFVTFPAPPDAVLGKHLLYSPRQVLPKSKKKKFSSEFEDRSAKKEDLLSFQRMFSSFENQGSALELITGSLMQLNRSCDGTDRNQALQEVS